MIKLLVIADDFTGALDTAVKFSNKNIKTQISIEKNAEYIEVYDDTQVLVVDLETRILGYKKSYDLVFKLCLWAKENNIKYIFKKTDSALRGNIGSEIKAVCDVFKKPVHFIPSFPKINRITIHGYQFINGIELKKSIFNEDPFDPVKDSKVSNILNKDIKIVTLENKWEENIKSEVDVIIHDSQSNEDILNILKMLKENNKVNYLAGCSALAEILVEVLNFETCSRRRYKKTKNLYIGSGSLNPITIAQIKHAKNRGFKNIHLDENDLQELKYKNKFIKIIDILKKDRCVIVDSLQINGNNNDLRFKIAKIQGLITKELLEEVNDLTVFLTGGDTVMGLINLLPSIRIEPIYEVCQGVVLSILEYNGMNIQLISKSGGFGEENVFIKVANIILKEGFDENCYDTKTVQRRFG